MAKLPKGILLVGIGNMGNALLSGMLQSKAFAPSQLWVADALPGRISEAKKQWGICPATDIPKAMGAVDTVVLCVKPGDLEKAILNLTPHLQEGHLLVSIAAGIGTRFIRNLLGKRAKVIRAMPNTPGLLQAGITAVATDKVASGDLKKANMVFGCIGKVINVPEKLMDAVTGLSGSGPAYVYMFLESLIDGGIQAGLPAATARELAIHTVLGASKMALESDEGLSALRHRVTSPGGTTIAGCKALEDKKFRSAVISAVEAAAQRSSELSK